MKITTLDIIKFLPLEKKFQSNLIAKFDSLTPDQKFDIEQMVWNAYEAVYKLKLEENTKIAFMNVEDGQEKLDENFYARIKDQTVKEIESDFFKDTAQNDIDDIRAKLEKIMKKTPQ
ncbi:MAG: hypothetical protein WC744_01910 [Patescibacteria group bacterium]|jgi:hypothetical protein